MAPEVEQLACRSHYSDMYSIGAVFHFMLFGEDHCHVKDGKKASAGLSATFMTAVSLVYALPVCGPIFSNALMMVATPDTRHQQIPSCTTQICCTAQCY